MIRNVYEEKNEIHCIYKSITVLWGQNRVCLVIKSYFEYYFNNSEISFVLALDLLITGSNANLQCTFQCSNMKKERWFFFFPFLPHHLIFEFHILYTHCQFAPVRLVRLMAYLVQFLLPSFTFLLYKFHPFPSRQPSSWCVSLTKSQHHIRV